MKNLAYKTKVTRPALLVVFLQWQSTQSNHYESIAAATHSLPTHSEVHETVKGKTLNTCLVSVMCTEQFSC